jgi:hypothetical protein
VAEAAKVIENTQRDLNIALMNELALIFDRMGIRTIDVLAAAGTKWRAAWHVGFDSVAAQVRSLQKPLVQLPPHPPRRRCARSARA